MTTDTTEHDDDLDLDEIDEQDNTPVVRLLRRQLETEKKRRVKETESLKADNAKAQRELAFAKAGLNDLDDDKRTALLAGLDGDVTPEAMRERAVKFGWAEPGETTATDVDEETRSEVAGQERISAAATGAQTGTGGVLKAVEVADWPTDRLLALHKKAPDEFERLKRGEDVPRPPGF